MSKFGMRMLAGVSAALALLLVIYAFEWPPVDSVQRGYRGLAMEENSNPRVDRAKVRANVLPEVAPPTDKAGQKASQVYTNVKVLGDMDANEFLRLMTDMTTWVSPEQGCAYCHDENDLAAERPYTKIVSRRMLEMVRYINGSWKTHVAETGVTCWACHRGQPVPASVWYADSPKTAQGAAGNRAGQNVASAAGGITALPVDPFTPFIKDGADLRVISATALPAGNRASIKQTEWTYSLMMHFSKGLGVNCTYCHNSRSFFAWDQSTPQRTTAWYGIRMTRDINTQFLEPLTPQFPASRLGPLGDVAKVNCATCHEGVYKPLYGANMVKEYPILVGPAPARTASAAPAGAK
ncbi:photosynthetic reaction center cytochrome c subunit [Rhodoplanes serenus]|jgi:photosynthetic reaction center cytochrome c subunit|uniref:Photosynthetic reaction center cytochrome c subunit n=1 Tax=Rhodoplanes serenus TaxID=200615 RepID=A0A327KCP7_9BRAD|nr:photosynthetic reaction center cytochrome PufC [Rhodoplanes serenus]MBI5114008.1 photosynthetic reaction center cytochrome c subunit [Rhodovulum sp.]MTW14689.1 photosynthetic reaction center cytochrome c subunit [Rhodoplanes serenus]RAI35435.1 photosynthetic reaction center cytochrome c subunit [Rhodoplanes serenus]VCU07094.1 Photosynthetic reaction center cytochrome c subunit [Rhodoplanes serenus]